jgi:hypothetical protein
MEAGVLRKHAQGALCDMSLAIIIYAVLFAGALLLAFALCRMASDPDGW